MCDPPWRSSPRTIFFAKGNHDGSESLNKVGASALAISTMLTSSRIVRRFRLRSMCDLDDPLQRSVSGRWAVDEQRGSGSLGGGRGDLAVPLALDVCARDA